MDEVLIEITHFEHLRKGEKSKVLLGLPTPNDSLIAMVECEGVKFIVAALSVTAMKEVTPRQFQGAIRGLLAALLDHVDAPQPTEHVAMWKESEVQ